ncbi:hypothetical protein [Burkholderia sp. 22PA0106]|uniref:hypothetical protein n=1 Tax=Burkholderia sp. 22PA0106 TaxID=3237371 RepID=UPI0039C38274
MPDIDWISVGSGLFGALVGGGATLLGAKLQMSDNAKTEHIKEASRHAAVLQALHDELETLRAVYMATAGGELVKYDANTPFVYYWPVTGDYFPVYHSHADFLGHIKDDTLRKTLIQTYTYAKGLLDSYRLNNIFVERHENAALLLFREVSAANQQMLDLANKQLAMYAPVLHQSHDRLLMSIDFCLQHLQKAGAH